MTDRIRVFVNATPLDLSTGARVGEAVAAYDPALVARVSDGTAYVTDGRGIEIEGDAPLTSGAILRVVVRARRGTDADA
jgi:hypothetical protein